MRPTVFISYSHRDGKWKDRLVTHLKVLEIEDELIVWDDRKIGAGDDWYRAIMDALADAQAAVLLITADFLTSTFIRREEVPTLLQRRGSEGVRIIPLLVKDCAWQAVRWLREMEIRPKDLKPLSARRADKKDRELKDLALEIRTVLGIADRARPGVLATSLVRRLELQRDDLQPEPRFKKAQETFDRAVESSDPDYIEAAAVALLEAPNAFNNGHRKRVTRNAARLQILKALEASRTCELSRSLKELVWRLEVREDLAPRLRLERAQEAFDRAVKRGDPDHIEVAAEAFQEAAKVFGQGSDARMQAALRLAHEHMSKALGRQD